MSPFCPKCRSEYRPGFATCSDCGSDLTEELPSLPDNPEERAADMVAVFDAPDQIAALTVSSFLNDNGIPAMVRSEQIPMYDGVAMMLFPKWGQVLVMGNQRDEAQKLVENFMAGRLLEEEDQEPDK